MPAPYLSLSQVPTAYTANPSAFQEVLKKAGTQIVKIAVIGDSQETQYGGFGDPYIPALNQQFAIRYGNAPCSTIGAGNYGGFSSGIGTDRAKWLKTARNALSGGTALYPTSKVLPNMSVTAINSNANYQSGKLFALNDKMSSAFNLYHRWTNFFDSSQGVTLELILGTRPDAAPITIGTAYNANWSHSFTLTDRITNIDPGLVAAGSSLLKYLSPTITGPTSAQWLYTGTKLSAAGTKAVDLVDGRFYTANPSKQYGVVVDNFGFGGYTAQQWYDAYLNTGEMLRTCGPYDMVVFHFGANDSTGTSAAHESALRLLIAYARNAHQNQRLPIVICSDGYRQHASTPIRDVYQTFPGIGMQLASEYENVMVINLQRMTDHLGYNDTSELETNYVDRGAWADATSYSVNDRVTVTPFPLLPGYLFQFACIEAHTSATASIRPETDRYWRPIKRYLTDGVHLNTQGADVAAQCFVNALYQGAFLANNAQPGLPALKRLL